MQPYNCKRIILPLSSLREMSALQYASGAACRIYIIFTAAICWLYAVAEPAPLVPPPVHARASFSDDPRVLAVLPACSPRWSPVSLARIFTSAAHTRASLAGGSVADSLAAGRFVLGWHTVARIDLNGRTNRPLGPTLERLRLWGGVKHLAQTRCWNSPTLGSE